VLQLVWRAEARADLLAIITYIADRNPAAADRLLEAIEHMAERLPAHPFLHHLGRVAGTREAIFHPNYIIAYRMEEAIEVLAILHARQLYP
jgi:addiction module RelE/StbE family toxin